MAEGIRRRHSKGCPPGWAGGDAARPATRRGSSRSGTGRRFASPFGARQKRILATRSPHRPRKGRTARARSETVEQAWHAWFPGAQAGTITNRSGDAYKPSALRSYEQAMRFGSSPPSAARAWPI